MSTAELNLTNSYWAILRNLSDDVKLRLASMLTSSVAENREKTVAQSKLLTEQMVAKYAGALEDDRSTDEIISSVHDMRNQKHRKCTMISRV